MVLAFTPVTSWSEEQEEVNNAEQEAERCISLVRIRQTTILEYQNILFYMIGGKIFKNHLPNRCLGLSKHNTYTYKTSLNRLCNVDFITVLHNHGSGFMRGASCGLGKFEPSIKENIASLKEEIAAAKKKNSEMSKKKKRDKLDLVGCNKR